MPPVGITKLNEVSVVCIPVGTKCKFNKHKQVWMEKTLVFTAFPEDFAYILKVWTC